jgi:hypothetical protein
MASRPLPPVLQPRFPSMASVGLPAAIRKADFFKAKEDFPVFGFV